jgi:hypothetical protein
VVSAWLWLIEFAPVRRYALDPGIGWAEVRAAWNRGRSL